MTNSEHKQNFFKKLNIPSMVIGIILTFLLTKLLDPLFEYMYSSLLNLGGNFISSISDATYKEISNGFSEQSSLFISYFLYLAICVLLGQVSLKSNESYKDTLNSLDDLEKSALHGIAVAEKNVTQTQSHQKYVSDSINEISTNLDEISDNIKDIKKQCVDNCNEILDYSSKMRKKCKRSHIILRVLSLVLLLTFIFMYAKMLFINNTITTTTNNIEIVSPYISDQDYKQLKSDFHSINNKKDYNNLENSLQEIAEKNSLSLKE